jgi:hypothetical protein
MKEAVILARQEAQPASDNVPVQLEMEKAFSQ